MQKIRPLQQLFDSENQTMFWEEILNNVLFFLTKKVNKQLKSLWVTKESPQMGHLRKKVVFYKRCIFSYIVKEKIFSGPFGDVHINDFFQNPK